MIHFRYLQEIGYTDTIIDVRSNRVRSLLGLNPAGNAAEKEEQIGGGTINGGAGGGVGASSGGSGGAGSSPGDPSGNSKRLSESQGRRAPAKKVPPASLAEAMIMDTEAAVMANFDFLAQEGVGVEVDDEDEMSDEMEDNTDDDADDASASNAATSKRNKMKAKVRSRIFPMWIGITYPLASSLEYPRSTFFSNSFSFFFSCCCSDSLISNLLSNRTTWNKWIVYRVTHCNKISLALGLSSPTRRNWTLKKLFEIRQVVVFLMEIEDWKLWPLLLSIRCVDGNSCVNEQIRYGAFTLLSKWMIKCWIFLWPQTNRILPLFIFRISETTWTPRQRKCSTSLAFWVATLTTLRTNCECRPILPTGVSRPSRTLLNLLLFFILFSGKCFFLLFCFYCSVRTFPMLCSPNLRSNGGRRGSNASSLFWYFLSQLLIQGFPIFISLWCDQHKKSLVFRQ